jgi:hypothetical protein
MRCAVELNNNGLIVGTARKLDSNGQPTGNPLPVGIVPISITFEPVGDNDNISDNKRAVAWDTNGNPTEWAGMPGGGKRIFPDAKTS